LEKAQKDIKEKNVQLERASAESSVVKSQFLQVREDFLKVSRKLKEMKIGSEESNNDEGRVESRISDTSRTEDNVISGRKYQQGRKGKLFLNMSKNEDMHNAV
jgi:hypothetical protein